MIEYVNAIAAETIFFGGGQPGCLEDLNEVGDVMLTEKVPVVDRSHGADVKGARCCSGTVR